MDDATNYIELYGLEIGDLVKTPKKGPISEYLSLDSLYMVIYIPVGSLSIFYILDNNDTELACLLGQPDIHLEGQLWRKYNK